MLSNKMIDKINEQINLEFYSSNLYLQMSAWCQAKSFEGTAIFLRAHALEEMGHMNKFFTYLSETGTIPLLGTIKAPISEYKSLQDLFEKIYEHECLVTKKINDLAHLSFTEQDYTTFNLLQWFIAEQHEEETLFKGICDKLALVKGDIKSLLSIDKELGNLNPIVGSQQA